MYNRQQPATQWTADADRVARVDDGQIERLHPSVWSGHRQAGSRTVHVAIGSVMVLRTSNGNLEACGRELTSLSPKSLAKKPQEPLEQGDADEIGAGRLAEEVGIKSASETVAKQGFAKPKRPGRR